jgi:ATPase family protein associated with various cellular activities (AAA)
LALWALLDVKDELVDGLTHLLPFLTKKRQESYVDRLQRLKMAATALVYAVFVEEASAWVKTWCTVHDPDPGGGEEAQTALPWDAAGFMFGKPPAIGPLVGFHQYRMFAEGTYGELALELSQRLAPQRTASESPQPRVVVRPEAELDRRQLVDRALARLEAAFVEMCANHDELLLWAQCDMVLRGNEGLGERLRDVLQGQETLDLGLARLQQLVSQLVSAAGTQVPDVIAAIHRAYADSLTSSISVTDDRPAVEGFSYPTKASAFIPQRFACVRNDAGTPIHDEGFWAQQPVRDDVGVFLLQSFLAADAVHRPLLILGHPGSGKSLLSEMLAARLTPPFFTTIRVPLRDTDASKEFDDQIEDAIRKATGEQVSWIGLSKQAAAPPIVIFDGLDELLLATGESHVAFLDKLAGFQHRELVQGRPVRIVVTSRMTLVHRMRVAEGTYVVRLLDFSLEQQQTWIDIWNGENSAYFASRGLRPFAVPDNELVQELAVQPLLLLMLAIYDAYENGLVGTAATSRAELYQSIIEKFVERQRGKGTTGEEFRALDDDARAKVVADDMDRLAIVALAMHKRARLWVTKSELDADLIAYGRSAEADPDDRFTLSSGEALLGEFFFVHRSATEAGHDAGEAQDRRYAFEFLHNTFGEFLLALLLAKRLGERCQALEAAASWVPDSEIPRMEAAAAELPDDFRDALQWQLLCLRPVVLDMLVDLLGRPELAELTTVDDLLTRELRRCTSGGTGQELRPRAVEGANLLSLAASLPEPLGTIAYDETRWQQVIGLLRGSLSFEDLTQLASGIETVVRDGAVEVHPARVVLSQSDVAAAAHRAAVALSDRSLVLTTRLATLDSLIGMPPETLGRLSGEELLLASRMLRPAVWRPLDTSHRHALAEQLGRSAWTGLEDYPNTALAAMLKALHMGYLSWDSVRPAQAIVRSLGADVEPEPVADLVFTMRPLATRQDAPESLNVAVGLVVDQVVVDLVTAGLPSAGSTAPLDRGLKALCWLVRLPGLLSERQALAVRDIVTDGLFVAVAAQAPSFAWLPSVAWLTFNPSPAPAHWLETWLGDEEAQAGLSERHWSAPGMILRALWFLFHDPDLLRHLLGQCASDRPLLTNLRVEQARESVWDHPTELLAGWRHLERMSEEAAAEQGIVLPSFTDWIRDEFADVGL